MLRHISSLKLQGANFETLTELPLFKKKQIVLKLKYIIKELFYLGETELGKAQWPKVLER